jgi:hypothetical protein
MSDVFSIAVPRPPRSIAQALPWGTIASIGLHGLLALAVILLTPLRQLVVPPPEPVAVEIVTPTEFAALEPKTEAPPVLTGAAPADEAAPPAPGDRLTPSPPLQPNLPTETTHKATQFYSASILKEPKMARIRKSLSGFDNSERLVQLCNIEGLEQIRRAAPKYDPDTLVGYAFADLGYAGLTLTATGGAFRSRRKWYGVSYTCTAAADLEGVTAFAFKLGDPIPEDEWEDHNLNAEDEDE